MRIACKTFLFFSFYFLVSFSTHSQTTHKVAVFIPLYIDSAFADTSYKLGNNNLPKTMLPGLEFYNGVMIAIDSLQAEGHQLEVNIYDTKSSNQPINSIISKEEFDGTSLIIASFNNRTEIKLLADYALRKNIPLISATYPNDGGVSNNSYFTIINSTLATHCEELYKHLQRHYSLGNIIFVTKKGAVESYIQSAFANAARNTASIPLKTKTVELPVNFTNQLLVNLLDSTRKNLVICGSIDEAFTANVIKSISSAKNYTTTIAGMPTWDGNKELDKPDYATIDFLYTSPFYYDRTLPLAINLSSKYNAKFNAAPTDMFFKGYESMYHFTKLLLQYGNDVNNHLSDKSYKLFNEFDIRPLRNKTTGVTDHLENRKLYLIKKTGGIVKALN
jgi:hypothetical protein